MSNLIVELQKSMGYKSKGPICKNCNHQIEAVENSDKDTCGLNPTCKFPIGKESGCKYFVFKPGMSITDDD